MRITARLVVGILGASVRLFAQAVVNPPAFEVASIKPSNPQAGRGGLGTGLYTYPGGRIVVSNFNLMQLIGETFDTSLFRFPNAPAWVNDDRYDIEARPPASSEASKSNPRMFKMPPNDEQREMLQTLLVERFHLKFHRETKEGSVYLLSKGNKTPKLQEAKDKEAYPWAGSFVGGGGFSTDGMAGINITMSQLAKRLTPLMGHPVLDHTGLSGAFDFKIVGTSDDARADEISNIISSLAGLGLKLEASKAPLETVIIDHAEKPSDN